jgi:hypothetical protein
VLLRAVDRVQEACYLGSGTTVKSHYGAMITSRFLWCRLNVLGSTCRVMYTDRVLMMSVVRYKRLLEIGVVFFFSEEILRTTNGIVTEGRVRAHVWGRCTVELSFPGECVLYVQELSIIPPPSGYCGCPRKRDSLYLD